MIGYHMEYAFSCMGYEIAGGLVLNGRSHEGNLCDGW